MSDHELEKNLGRSLPKATPESLDRRILAAAATELKRRRRPRRFGKWAVAAAVLALIAGGALWRVLDQDAPGIGRLELADGAVFVLDADTDFEIDRALSRLDLKRGAVRAEVGRRPLEVRFPRGRLELRRGSATVRVVVEGDPEMSAITRRLGLGAAAVSLAAFVTIQLHDDGEGTVQVEDRTELVAPASIEIAIPSDSSRSARVLSEDPSAARSELVEEPEAAAEEGEASEVKPYLFGRVEDKETGEPIAGAEVMFSVYPESDLRAMLRENWRDGSSRVSYSLDELEGKPMSVIARGATSDLVGTTSDDEGRFLYREFPPNSTQALVVRHQGYAPYVLNGRPSSIESGEAVIVEMVRSATVTGQLVDSTGRAIRGGDLLSALEWAIFLSDGDPVRKISARVPLGSDGTFELEGTPGTKIVLDAQAEGFESARRSVFLRPGSQHIDITLTPSSFLSGKVRNVSGEPIAGAWIEVTSVKRRLFFEEAKRTASVQSDEEGYYRIGIVGPDIELIAEHAEYATIRLEDPGVDRDDLDLVLPPLETGSLTGLVKGADGAPLEGASIQLYRSGAVQYWSVESTTQTADDGTPGRFRYDALREGTYELTVQRETLGELDRPEDGTVPNFIDITTEDIEIRPGKETEIEIVVAVGGSIFGQFFDESGNPARASVSLFVPDLIGGKHKMVTYSQTDDEGRYNFSGVPEGTYAVTRGFGSQIKIVQVKEGESVEVNFGGRLGEVHCEVFFEGQPLQKASVSVGRLEGGSIESRETGTGVDGTFIAKELPLGPALARIVHPENEQTIWVEVSSNSPAVPEHIDWPSGRIRGRIEGAPLPSDVPIEVSLIAVAGQVLEGKIPADYRHIAIVGSTDGRTFEVHHLAKGRYRIRAKVGERTLEGTCELFGEQDVVEAVIR
ncbi:MAG: carboxypeptidase-like regulatory domain-containing protein [Planctomycetota bacterium]